MKKTKEIVLHYDEIIRILKKSVAENAGDFLGLTYKQRDDLNIICDESSLIVPQEGLRFESVESPVDYK